MYKIRCWTLSWSEKMYLSISRPDHTLILCCGYGGLFICSIFATCSHQHKHIFGHLNSAIEQQRVDLIQWRTRVEPNYDMSTVESIEWPSREVWSLMSLRSLVFNVGNLCHGDCHWNSLMISNNGSENGLVPTDNKPLPEQKMEPVPLRYMASLGHN